MRGSRVAVLFVVALLLGAGAGWYLAGIYAKPTGPGTGPPAKLFVGTNTPFPPFEFRNATTDDIEGFDIDLLTEVLRRMGYENTATVTEWEVYDFRDFSALLAAVGTGRVDIAASAITMNGAIGTARNVTMDFTDSYYESDQGILKRTGDAVAYCADANACTAAELDGLNVSVQGGTSSEFWVADNLPNANVQIFPDVVQVLQALQSGAVDIIVIDRPAAVGISAGNPTQFTVAGTIQTDELFSFAVANNDPLDIVGDMNQALTTIKADGTYDDIVAKWF